jgi:HlyD family secretion protein
MSKKQKTWIVGGVSAVVIIGLVLVFLSVRAQNSSNSSAAYQTTTVQRGILTSTVEGSGTVASTQSANLSWQTSGQVGQVNAKIGDQVKAGEVLATLIRDSRSQNSLETDLIAAQENLAEMTSPEAIANAKLAVTAAEADVINAQIVLNNQQYWKNDALIQDQYANMVIAKDKLDRAQAAYDNAHVGEYINNPGEAALYQALYNAQQAYNTAKFNYSLYSQKPTQRQFDQAQANLELAKATLTNSQIYLAALTSGAVPADATGTALLKLKQAKLSVQTAQENVGATTLTAPFDGTVTQANAIPGAVIAAGSQVFRVDNLSNLVVAVQVTEIDINGIQAGQPAMITFNAIPNKTYDGTVIKTDLAGTVGQNTTNFSVTIQITNADAKVKPGMAANVAITTNKVDNALMVPSTAIFTDNNGQQYVYLIQNGNQTTVPVAVGAVSDTTTQITQSTLKEGDMIILSFASTSSTSGGGFGLGGLGGFGGGNVRVIEGSGGNGGPQPVVNP